MFTLDETGEEERDLALSIPEDEGVILQTLYNKGHRFPMIVAMCAARFSEKIDWEPLSKTECIRALLSISERDLLRLYPGNGVKD